MDQRKIVLQNLHDATQMGDINTVKEIFDTYTDIHIDITRRGRNTTLHTALLHNQEGPIIDYLIERGANVNIMNTKGHCPITLAIMHCKNGCKAVGKLITAGANYTCFTSGSAFEGLSAMDVAVQYKNEHVINLFKRMEEEHNICKEVDSYTSSLSKKNKYRQICPICNILVTYPTKMSRIEQDQTLIEQRIQTNGEYNNTGTGKTKRKKYITRKYMDELLTHSNGEVYKKLCGIEYHGVENMRLRKEISESMGVLHAVQSCCVSLGISSNNISDDDGSSINLQNIFLIDLCSGKGITTALCGAMNGQDGNNNNYFLAIDKMLIHTIPHFLTKDKVHYLCRDVMTEELFGEISNIVEEQTKENGRTCILVGMHLCGILSERAIDLFEKTNGIRGIVLSPCCLPRKNDMAKIRFTKGRPEPGEEGEGESIELFNYFKWAGYLKERVEGYYSSSGATNVQMYKDNEMHTDKNAVIVGTKS